MDKISYWSVIPANVRYDQDLKPNAKLLYGEISALCNEKGYCWATNQYFSEMFNVSKATISRWISQLAKKGYIALEFDYVENTREIKNRYIVLGIENLKGIDAFLPIETEIEEELSLSEKADTTIDKKINTYCQKNQYPIDEKVKDIYENNYNINNKENKNIINNIFTKEKKRKDFKPPTKEEVEKYAEFRKLQIDVDFFYTYYNDSSWIDGKGQAIKSWKQKMLTWDKKAREKEQKSEEIKYDMS